MEGAEEEVGPLCTESKVEVQKSYVATSGIASMAKTIEQLKE